MAIDHDNKMKPAHIVAEEFWQNVVAVAPSDSEAEVERKLILPLLGALGFQKDEIESKVRVQLTHGSKRGRSFEADIVAYSSKSHNRNTSLLVVEAKAPGKDLGQAKLQGESYAMALRAPVLLLTDGIVLEVWQLHATEENQKVFASAVSELRQHRGAIEECISKLALIAHASTLVHKKFSESFDFKAYAAAESARTVGAERAIKRRLVSSQKDVVLSDALLEKHPHGAIISAASGYGKSTLSAQILRQAIQEKKENSALKWPVEVSLVDLDIEKIPVLSFVQARIEAHYPQLTSAGATDIARNLGFIFLFDGYEHVKDLDFVHVQFRKLARDFPKSQIFVFSRVPTNIGLELETLHLQALNEEDRKEIVSRHSLSDFPAGDMPRLLHELSDVPLLFERVLAFWKENRKFPTRVDQLFEHWVEQLLGSTHRYPLATLRHKMVLSVLAMELGSRTLTPLDAITVTCAHGGNEETFAELVQRGALRYSARSVQFIHDGLADYFRAQTLIDLPAEEFRDRLAILHIDESALLPVLLIASSASPESKKIIWQRLRTMSLPRFIDAIRYAGATKSAEKMGGVSQRKLLFATEMFEGINSLIDSFFEPLSAKIRAELAGDAFPSDHLALAIHLEEASVISTTYAFSRSNENSVNLVGSELEVSERNFSFVPLTSHKLGMDDGRYFGALVVKNSLKTLVAHRHLKGGVLHANERCIARLTALPGRFQRWFNQSVSLAEIKRELEPEIDSVVVNDPWGRTHPKFTIRELVDDIHMLELNGRTHLDWWWLAYGQSIEEISSDRERLTGFLREHYRRVIELYAEIANISFGRVVTGFGLMQAKPMRWHLDVYPARDRTFADYTLSWHWTPVSHEDNAGVDIVFSDSRPTDLLNDRNYGKQLREQLEKLGRFPRGYAVKGSRMLPRLPPSNILGKPSGESSVMKEAYKYIEKDIGNLFADLPDKIFGVAQ